MSRRFELPDGSYAMLRDQGVLSRGDRKALRRAQAACRPVRRKLKEMGLVPANDATDEEKAALTAKLLDPEVQEQVEDALTPDEAEANDDYQAAMIVAYVESWSGGPKPTMENLDEMDSKVFDALAAELAGVPPGEDFSPTKAEDSPTEPSAA